MTTDCTILDDGKFFMDLNLNFEVSSAPGFLMRRLDFGPKIRSGFEAIGSFEKATSGAWKAKINARYDPATDGDSITVIEGATRLDAIATLWQQRHNAHCQLV